jgi:hypothetical protein
MPRLLAHVAALLAVIALPSIAACVTNGPPACQLNGECVNGACVCDTAWKGQECGELDLNPKATVAYGYGGLQANTSSW